MYVHGFDAAPGDHHRRVLGHLRPLLREPHAAAARKESSP